MSNSQIVLQKFYQALRKSAEKIEEKYFFVKVAYRNEVSLRERIYCYELYHQLRSNLPIEFGYTLFGEPDKSGHPEFKRALKPDFIFHVPGTMENNVVVIEVKPIDARRNKIREAIKNLKVFLETKEYGYAILLVFGLRNELPEKFTSTYDDILGDFKSRSFLIWHCAPKMKLHQIRP